MSRASRTAAGAVVAMMAVSMTLVASPPASAAVKYIGAPGAADSRCKALVCLYYNYWDQAYWGTNSGDGDLANNTYVKGTGDGSGQVVRNNSRKMMCSYDVPAGCHSYYGPNMTGNADFMWWGYSGELFYTWNDNASVYYL